MRSRYISPVWNINTGDFLVIRLSRQGTLLSSWRWYKLKYPKPPSETLPLFSFFFEWFSRSVVCSPWTTDRSFLSPSLSSSLQRFLLLSPARVWIPPDKLIRGTNTKKLEEGLFLHFHDGREQHVLQLTGLFILCFGPIRCRTGSTWAEALTVWPGREGERGKQKTLEPAQIKLVLISATRDWDGARARSLSLSLTLSLFSSLSFPAALGGLKGGNLLPKFPPRSLLCFYLCVPISCACASDWVECTYKQYVLKTLSRGSIDSFVLKFYLW